MDGVLDFMEFSLGVEVASGYRVIQERLPVLFEIGDLFTRQGSRKLLLLLQGLALFYQSVVMRSRRFIRRECFNSLADGFYVRLFQNRLAQFQSFPGYRGLFNGHLYSQLFQRGHLCRSARQPFNTA